MSESFTFSMRDLVFEIYQNQLQMALIVQAGSEHIEHHLVVVGVTHETYELVECR